MPKRQKIVFYGAGNIAGTHYRYTITSAAGRNNNNVHQEIIPVRLPGIGVPYYQVATVTVTNVQPESASPAPSITLITALLSTRQTSLPALY